MPDYTLLLEISSLPELGVHQLTGLPSQQASGIALYPVYMFACTNVNQLYSYAWLYVGLEDLK